MNRGRRFLSVWGAALVVIGLTSCGGGDSSSSEGVTLVFRMHGHSSAETFRARVTSPQEITRARAQLTLPQAQRTLFPAGLLAAGSGGQNPGWSWHFSEVALVESAIEVCDGRPSMVEADLGYWLRTVKSFCPWGAYVEAEEP